MRTFDFSPLFRSSVGYDRMQQLFDAATRLDEAGSSYPPYNIEKLGEDDYRITMAVAGFSGSDLDVTAENGTLAVSGRNDRDNAAERTFLHRGIATRAFERRFQLADHIKVVGARLADGLLHIDLVREVPDAMKPRRIAIECTASAAPALEQDRDAA